MWDPVDDAIYRVIHDFAGGAVKLAPRINMNAGTLINKANPLMEGHKLSVKEALAAQLAAQDFRILHAEAQALNHCCISLGDFSKTSDVELLEAYAAWHADIGRTSSAVLAALEDRRITREECARVRGEIQRDIQRAFEFLARLESLVDDGGRP